MCKSTLRGGVIIHSLGTYDDLSCLSENSPHQANLCVYFVVVILVYAKIVNPHGNIAVFATRAYN